MPAWGLVKAAATAEQRRERRPQGSALMGCAGVARSVAPSGSLAPPGHDGAPRW
jgi:hypothetical protein